LGKNWTAAPSVVHVRDIQTTTQSNAPGAASHARLFLGGVGTAVRAEVCHRSAEGMSVRHALPFLRLDSEVVDDEGRAARISSVHVSLEGGVPTLHMELSYPKEAKEAKARRDETLPYGFVTERGAALLAEPASPGPATLALPDAEPRGLLGAFGRLLARLFARRAVV
jgi:hypothetical protein